MNILMKNITLIERIDRLIHRQATGTPDQLADRLNISKTKLYRIINMMKELGAPIEYDFAKQRFIYEEEVGFRFGFFHQTSLSGDRLNPFVG